MAKIRLTAPTFVAASKTVTHASFSDVTLAGIQLIVNVTDGIIIYNFADATKGGTLATDTLTLEYDTTAMSDADELMVLVEDGVAYQLPTNAATADNQASFADDAAFTLSTSKGAVVEGVAVAMDGTDPTVVSAEGDAAAFRTDMSRILLVNQTHPRFFRACVDYASAQTNATVQAAPGAGLSLYITDLIISNGATAGNVTLLDGSAGTLLFELYPAVNGGVTMSFRNPIKLTANTLLAITSTTVTTHAITVTGYIAA